MPTLKIALNTRDLMLAHAHGYSDKTNIALHETVSGDQRGTADISNVEDYLAKIGYGIHGMTDKEANIAWAKGLGRAIFYHAGGFNTWSIGIEQVFKGAVNNPKDSILWAVRQGQLRATAKLIACICRSHPAIPIQYSDSTTPGITSHWDISQIHPESDGHWDCHPIHKGGYYPMLQVVQMAKTYYKLGWKF